MRLFDSGYIGNGTTVVIFENEEIKEVYKIRLYGDYNGDGRINAADLAGVRKTVLGASDTYDGTVRNINADGGTDIKDLIKLKKCQANTGAINQSRMFAYSSRFSGLNSAEVPAGHPHPYTEGRQTGSFHYGYLIKLSPAQMLKHLGGAAVIPIYLS